MLIRNLTDTWKNSSILAKAGIGAVLLVFVLLIAGGTKSCVSHYKDRQADKAIAEERAKSEEHRKRADEAEERAKKLELDLKGLEGDLKVADIAIKAAGQRSEAAVEKIQDEDKRWVAEQEALGVDVDPCDRVKRTCTKFRIPPKECSCTSN